MSIEIGRIASIAEEAGEMVKRRFKELTSADVSRKCSETDIVTVADRESEALIRERLKAAYPEIGFYGEEGAYGVLDSYESVFIVDPIDGTTNYLHGYPFYCVSIGLREHGVTTAGVVYLPYTGDSYTAERGKGSYKNGVRLHVSRVRSFIDAVGACGFACIRGHLKPDTVELAGEMVRRLQGFRRSGSAAIDLCHVADGCLDLYWEFKLSPWDYEAGRLIAEEAGAVVTGFDGRRIDDSKGQVLATNGLLHGEMLAVIQDYLARQEQSSGVCEHVHTND